VPTVPTVIICAILLTLIAIAAALFTAFGRTGRTPLWLVTVFAILFLFAFLTWAAADARPIPVPGLLGGALVLSVPLIFGALGGVISERVGVVNVAIEGQLLFGAFTAALVASLTQNAFAGLDQVNLLLPVNVRGSGEIEIQAYAGGEQSNPVRVVIR